MIGVSISVVSRLKEVDMFYCKNYGKICKTHNCSVDDIFKFEYPMKNNKGDL